jgi:hypothetical protein
MQRPIKSLVMGTAALAAFAGIATSSHAQTKTLPVQYPFAVKLGIAFPSDSKFSKSVFDGGVSYDLSKTTADNPVVYQVYGDYYGKGSANVFGIGVAAQFQLGNALNPTRPYVGAGIGDYTAHVPGSSTKSNIGGKVFAGYNFTQNVFAEADYSITQKVNSVSPNAIGLRLGYRF